MKAHLIPLFALALLCSCGSDQPEDSTEAANDSNNEKFDNNDSYEADAAFAVKAADGGMFEVKLADLALSKSSNNDVRAFAELMKKDHGAANEELRQLANNKNISLPDSVSSDKMDEYRKLAEKSGTDFDKEYIDMMVDDHDDDIQMFDKEAMGGTEPDIRNWASAKLPTLRDHYDKAKQTQEKLKGVK